MINFSNIEFISSIAEAKEAPKDGLPQVLLCGRSNVGKSSFINAIANRKNLAFTSSKPGHTKLLNFFKIDNKAYLVDAPGYGYATGGVDLDSLFAKLMDDYFSTSVKKIVVILLDSRRELSNEDIELINFVDSKNIPLIFVFTKADKLNQKEKAACIKHIKEVGVGNEYFFTSINNSKSFDPVKGKIDSFLTK